MAGQGDGASMDTDAVTQAMGGLGGAGDAFAGQWAGTRATIAAGEGQLGRGLLGEAFMRGYRGPADQLSQAITGTGSGGVAGGMHAAAKVGNQSASDYQHADARGAAAMPGGH